MNLLSNPIVMCGLIAFGIILVLISVVVICCRKSTSKEREELKALSEEIEADICDEITDSTDDKIENVLSKMQEALDSKEENSISFEEEQEENAIISYQELLNSLGAKSSIDVDSIEVFDDELENQVSISDFNKEIIDSYQREDLEREIYRFQNDYSSEAMTFEQTEDSPVMNFDFSVSNVDDCEIINSDSLETESPAQDVYEFKHGSVNGEPKKFKKTQVISPVYGIISEEKQNDYVEEIEEIIFEDDSLLDEF